VANIQSQIKRNRQNERRHLRSKAVRSRLKTYTRRFFEAVQAADREEAEEAYRVAARQYDKAVSKGVIHANRAANQKSRMSKALNDL
jgi:small subunit ribosomal protein S20